MESSGLFNLMGADFSLMTLLAAFVFGLMGSAHCLGMCGGIMSTLTLARSSSSTGMLPLLAYNSGRIFSYTLAGTIVASLGALLSDSLLVIAEIMRIVASIILIMMACYIANWWKGLVYIEHAGRYLWKYLQPTASRLMPVRTNTQALLLGLVWGWLPCGLVYSILIWALSVAHPLQGAAIMLFFGLGTLPAMLMTGLLASQIKDLSRSSGVRSVAAIIIIIFALWQLAPLFNIGQHHAHSGGASASHMSGTGSQQHAGHLGQKSDMELSAGQHPVTPEQ
ncbi:sulfite exporter TauE/SafE family protein [Oceanospirillum sp.]|uniref:sulfite exporter TauE/SafE family protein n=1 Tax=Oceanospirillum sp. TaxID=2021254 RepID=UPI003A8DA766